MLPDNQAKNIVGEFLFQVLILFSFKIYEYFSISIHILSKLKVSLRLKNKRKVIKTSRVDVKKT